MSPYFIGDSRLPSHVAVKIAPPDEHGCWLWTAAKTSAGYGETWNAETKQVVLAHRYVYELLVGPIPIGMELDHVCRVITCVNPDPKHLEPVTHAENARRGQAGKYQRERWANATHCKANHAYAEHEVWIRDKRNTSGWTRACRECRRIRYQAGKARAALL